MAEELVEVVVGSRRAETRRQRTGSKGNNNERRGGWKALRGRLMAAGSQWNGIPGRKYGVEQHRAGRNGGVEERKFHRGDGMGGVRAAAGGRQWVAVGAGAFFWWCPCCYADAGTAWGLGRGPAAAVQVQMRVRGCRRRRRCSSDAAVPQCSGEGDAAGGGGSCLAVSSLEMTRYLGLSSR